jgi:2-polyprenyl-3-methyl-5-hydroxy-6-metoxy-1,4-benzoquinol methylase
MGLKQMYRKTADMNKRLILRMIEREANTKFLDCGCGAGEFTMEIAKCVGTDSVYGLEFIAESAKSAKEKGIIVYTADLNQGFPIENEFFDFVCANQVIEHLYETDMFIKEIYRVLKPGGYAIISTNNLASLHNVISLLFAKQPFAAHVSNEVIIGTMFNSRMVMHQSRGHVHFRIFTYLALIQLFEYHGFKIEISAGSGYYPFRGMIAALLSHVDPFHSVYANIKVRKPANIYQ